jgi:solute carrier family 25 phosphate transporter 3
LASGIYEEKGFGGFYAGFSARLAHVAAIVTTQLVLYDFLKQLLGLPATVSA